jgi:KaiC/GvpD/RAD55 family RecA-like ATPase
MAGLTKSSSGIKKLDEMLGGGFPQSGTIMITGPAGVGKSTFCQQFLNQGVTGDEPTVYITLDAAPDDIIDEMKKMGWKTNGFLDGTKMIFLDAYSWKVGGSKEEPWKKVLQGGLDINSLNVMFSEILNKIRVEKKRSIFDSVSTLLLYIPSEIVVKFIPIIIAKGRSFKTTQIIVLEGGIHGDQLVNTLNYLSDGVIEMKLDGNKRFMRVSKMKGTSVSRDWLEFKINGSGISLV